MLKNDEQFFMLNTSTASQQSLVFDILDDDVSALDTDTPPAMTVGGMTKTFYLPGDNPSINSSAETPKTAVRQETIYNNEWSLVESRYDLKQVLGSGSYGTVVEAIKIRYNQ